MRSAVFRVGLVCMLLVLVSAACGNKPGASEDPVHAGEADSGEHVELLEGQVLELVLPENPSTGFHWKVEEFDDDVLEQLGPGSYTADDAESGVVGGGGEITFRFKGLRPGETELVLGDIPPGEDSAEGHFDLDVEVTEATHDSGHGDDEEGEAGH